jgi:hypothetical protein
MPRLLSPLLSLTPAFVPGSSNYGPTSCTVNGNVTANSLIAGSSNYGSTSASVNGNATASSFIAGSSTYGPTAANVNGNVTANSLIAASSTYGGTSATVNGPLTCSGGTLAAPSGYSSLTMVGTQFVFYNATTPVLLISSAGNAQFSGQLTFNAGVISGPTFTVVPANASGYVFRNAANTSSPMTVSNTGALTILGTGTQPGSVFWSNPSDIRLKHKIEPHTDGLDTILALKPIAFEYSGEGGIEATGKRFVGLSAQDAQAVIPRTVSKVRGVIDGDETDVLTVNASELLFTLINAVKDLSAEIDTLRKPKRGFFAWFNL